MAKPGTGSGPGSRPPANPGRSAGRPASFAGGKARPAPTGKGKSAAPVAPPAPPPKPISPARTAAFEVLMLVGAGRGHSDELLHSSRLSALSTADKGLATALVLGSLRWQIALDARLHTFLSRPDTRVADQALVAMRLAAFQLQHMDRIPAHAALSESVELCRWSGQPHAAGMVNAILRRLLREPALGPPIYESTPAFAERLGHPTWLAERWVAAYGRDAALQICEAGQREPVPPTLFSDPHQTPAPGDTSTPPAAPLDAADVDLASAPAALHTDPTRALPVMDDGSRLVAEIAAALLPDTPGRRARVWDCCAAPGGKTMVLAHRLSDRADLLATDISARRLTAMQDRLHTAGYTDVRCATHEVAHLPADEGTFDLILCDVPCTGTGTLARNPEIRHRLAPDQLPRQAERQQALLRAALSRLAPSGRLVYATCSLEPEECQHVVDAVLADGTAHRIDAAPAIQHLITTGIFRPEALTASLVQAEALRTLPGVHPTDGFYAAVLTRP